jgi:hypothetical protein
MLHESSLLSCKCIPLTTMPTILVQQHPRFHDLQPHLIIYRSYGSVHKAIHNRTSTVCAIKMIPIENDLDESIKEINIMTGCDSSYVVQFYGSYLKETHLWVCMRILIRRKDIKSNCYVWHDERVTSFS